MKTSTLLLLAVGGYLLYQRSGGGMAGLAQYSAQAASMNGIRLGAIPRHAFVSAQARPMRRVAVLTPYGAQGVRVLRSQRALLAFS